jgi:hypothetical protein
MNISELKEKFIGQMTGEEFLFLQQKAVDNSTEASPGKKYVYGIGCSMPTVHRIKKSGKIDQAITQIGLKIIVDAELALELAGKVGENKR